MTTNVLIRHKSTGVIKQGCYGVSWTYMFFGPFVPLYRDEPMDALLQFLFIGATGGLYYVYLIFTYNKQWMHRHLTSGWELADSESSNALAAAALGIQLPGESSKKIPV
jgi:hypothetical protein